MSRGISGVEQVVKCADASNRGRIYLVGFTSLLLAVRTCMVATASERVMKLN